VKPSERPTAAELLRHPFLQRAATAPDMRAFMAPTPPDPRSLPKKTIKALKSLAEKMVAYRMARQVRDTTRYPKGQARR
jgi:uncharacterized protein (UPF0254 family)